MQITKKIHDESGIASIFVVIFAAILMSVVSVSFITVMLQSQRQATNDELSQTAYDSATSGVEDAKRAIAFCLQNSSPTNGCQDTTNGLGSQNCQTLSRISGLGIATSTDPATGNVEYPIQGSEGANTLNQAYTCVTINNTPSDYAADMGANTSTVIPLNTSTSSNTLTFQWKALPGHTFTAMPTSTTGFLDFGTWSTRQKYPPVIRLQLIRGVGNPEDSTNASTLFLYPSSIGSPTADFAVDFVHSAPTTGKPAFIFCGTGGNSCSVLLKDTAVPSGNIVTDRSREPINYLVVTPLYGDASITMKLSGGNYFVGLQDVVDSTGRANDLFRRLQARVDLIPHPTYPNAELSLTGPLCKNFAVTLTAIDTTSYAGACRTN